MILSFRYSIRWSARYERPIAFMQRGQRWWDRRVHSIPWPHIDLHHGLSSCKGSLAFYGVVGGKLYSTVSLLDMSSFPNGNGKRTSGTDQAHDVTLPGNATMAELRTTITENETNCQIAVDSSQKAIDTTREQSEMDPKKLEFLQRQKDNAKEQISFFENLAKSLKHLQPLDNRVVGHAVLSPPIAVGKPHNYMMDWCMYEIDTHKLEYFSGNVVDLGTKISAERLVQVMNPNIQNSLKFFWPYDRHAERARQPLLPRFKNRPNNGCNLWHREWDILLCPKTTCRTALRSRPRNGRSSTTHKVQDHSQQRGIPER